MLFLHLLKEHFYGNQFLLKPVLFFLKSRQIITNDVSYPQIYVVDVDEVFYQFIRGLRCLDQ